MTIFLKKRSEPEEFIKVNFHFDFIEILMFFPVMKENGWMD